MGPREDVLALRRGLLHGSSSNLEVLLERVLCLVEVGNEYCWSIAGDEVFTLSLLQTWFSGVLDTASVYLTLELLIHLLSSCQPCSPGAKDGPRCLIWFASRATESALVTALADLLMSSEPPPRRPEHAVLTDGVHQDSAPSAAYKRVSWSTAAPATHCTQPQQELQGDGHNGTNGACASSALSPPCHTPGQPTARTSGTEADSGRHLDQSPTIGGIRLLTSGAAAEALALLLSDDLRRAAGCSSPMALVIELFTRPAAPQSPYVQQHPWSAVSLCAAAALGPGDR